MSEDYDWDDTPGETLPSRSEPIDFTASRRVTEVRVVYKEEYAYRTGNEGGAAFEAPFLESTISSDGTAVSLKRTGGWNQRFRVYPVQEAASSPTVPALQPVSESPFAMWALDGGTTGDGYTDRSGNGRHINGSIKLGGDLIIGTGAQRASLLQYDDPFNTFRTFGELTVIFRYARWSDANDGTLMASFGGANQGSWRLSTTAGKLLYTANGGNTFNMASGISPSQWVWGCFRRASDGNVTLQINDTVESSTGLSVPTSGGLEVFRLGGDTSLFDGGLMKDVGIWMTRLSDSSVAARRATMMGLSP